MKFKKMFSIVLIALICFNTFCVKAFADDVTNENITSDSDMTAAVTQGTVSGKIQLADNDSKVTLSDKVENIIKKLLQPSVTAKAATVPVKRQATALSGTAKPAYNKADLRLLSSIIYCEARGESYAGKLAVGIVVMNRKRSSQFPNTVKGVIYQKRQFQPTRNEALKKALARYDAGKFKSSAEKQCIKAAKEALDGTKKVVYKSKTINLKSYYFFSRYLKGCRVRIGHHQFK